jgi:hypothetical protein
MNRKDDQMKIAQMMDHPEINQAVRHGVTRYWPPGQMAGRLKLVDRDGERLKSLSVDDAQYAPPPGPPDPGAQRHDRLSQMVSSR